MQSSWTCTHAPACWATRCCRWSGTQCWRCCCRGAWVHAAFCALGCGILGGCRCWLGMQGFRCCCCHGVLQGGMPLVLSKELGSCHCLLSLLPAIQFPVHPHLTPFPTPFLPCADDQCHPWRQQRWRFCGRGTQHPACSAAARRCWTASRAAYCTPASSCTLLLHFCPSTDSWGNVSPAFGSCQYAV